MRVIKISDETHKFLKEESEKTHISMSKLVALKFDKKERAKRK